MIVAGLVAFVATFALLSNRSAEVTVAVARTTVDPGTELSIDNVRAENIPADSPLANDLTRFADVKDGGTYASRRLVEGEPVTKAAVAEKLSSRNQREVVIASTGAVVTTGDRVDIVSTKGSCYVATNVEVLALVGSSGGGLGGAGSSTRIVVGLDSADTALKVTEAEEANGLRIVKATGAEPTRTDCK